MDAKQFLAEFKHIASAPGGIQRLRELILSFALQGKFVSQDPSDEPASELLERIDAKKELLFRERKIKRTDPLPSIDGENLPYPLPATWRWVYLDRISNQIHYGYTARAIQSRSGVRLLRITDIQNNKVDWERVPSCEISERDIENYRLNDGDIVIARTGGTIGKSYLIKNLSVCAVFASYLIRIVPSSEQLPEYLKLALESPLYWKQLYDKSMGTGQPNVNGTALRSLLIPLPPFNEQKRIVAKVDELMALCDKLESQQREREMLGKRTCLSTLNALAEANTLNELKTTWYRAQENFLLLLDVPSGVDDINAVVRELALRGLLSISGVETVDALLEAIAKQKKGKRVARLQSAAQLFDIPAGWRWVLLEDLLHGSDSGWSPKCEPGPREQDEWGVLKVSAVTWGQFQSNENKKLSDAFKPAVESEVKPGDYLLSRANTAELVARSVITPEDCPRHLMMSDKIVRLNFIDDSLKPWVNLVNNSRFARKYYVANATGTSNSMKNVSRQVIHELPIPLPPLATQINLIAITGKIESLCESLKRQMTQSRAMSQDFAIACIVAITGIRIEEKEKMKAPKTELVSNLRLGANPTNGDHAPLTAILSRNQGELSAKTLWNASELEIDAFYQQLKAEMAKGWIVQPEIAYVKEVEAS
jgi:type I restriction enzyme, S subunit